MRTWLFVCALILTWSQVSTSAAQGSASEQVAQSGFCSALDRKDYRVAKTLFDQGGVDLKKPCQNSLYGEVSPEITLNNLVHLLSLSYVRYNRTDLEDLGFLIQEFLKVNGGINAYGQESTPLFWRYGDKIASEPTVAKVFIEAGADFRLAAKAPEYGTGDFQRFDSPTTDKTGRTFLMQLCWIGNFDQIFAPPARHEYNREEKELQQSILRKVIANADLKAQDAYGRTALHHCTLQGSVNAIRELIKAGADADQKDAAGLTPKDYAKAAGKTDLSTFSRPAEEQVTAVPAPLESDTSGVEAVEPNPTPASAAPDASKDLQLAKSAIEAGQFRNARALLQNLVGLGNPAAMYELGRLIIRGEGGAQDFEEARKLWERAAEREHGESLVALAKLYVYGDGVAKSEMVAKMYLKRAKDAGAQIPQNLIE